jgi:ribosome maturation factor RimP
MPEYQDSYQLEVSSPGLERKLRRPSHFHKSVGREVKVKTSDGAVNGVITGAGEDDFALELEGGERRHLRYEEVVQAKTVFRWEKAPKPGH